MTPPLHAAVEHLAFLLGVWRGTGHGAYPTIEGFDYGEEVRCAHIGKPFLSYVQRTWHADTAAPLHSESGYLRGVGDGAFELVLVQPSGIVEIHQGSLDGQRLELRSIHVLTSPTAKEVTEVSRFLEVVGDTLSYRLDMAAMGQPLQQHLVAELHRVGG